MPRARNIKPGFFMNEELAECTPTARLVFIGLWCLADRDGRLEDRPKRIRAFVFPYENYNVDELLNQLQEHGFILRYEVDGSKYIQVLNFKKHQKPHPREATSDIPPPEEDANGNCNSAESREKALPSHEKVLPSNGKDMTSPADILNPDILNPDILNPDILNPDILNADTLNADENTRPSADENVGLSVREPPGKDQSRKPKKQILSNVQLERFNQFWEQYPKKKAKLAAMKAWAKLKPDEILFGEIMYGLSRARSSMEWKREGGRFIPHPATFLNQGRWEDEYLQSEQRPTKRDLQSMSIEEYVEAVAGGPDVSVKDIDELWGDAGET